MARRMRAYFTTRRRSKSRNAEMKRHGLIAAAVGAALLASAVGSQAIAHHAFTAEFDANSPVLLKGVVTKVEWINPHSWIHITVKAPGKPAQLWMIEGGTPNALIRNGVD